MKRLPTKELRRRCAELILRGRYGRACRLYARHLGHSPRLLPTKELREQWARKQL